MRLALAVRLGCLGYRTTSADIEGTVPHLRDWVPVRPLRYRIAGRHYRCVLDVPSGAQLGYLPRLRITHTSAQTAGQIYLPWINWVLLISVPALVLTFWTSTALAFAFAFGLAVTATITIILFCYVVRQSWGKPLWVVLPGATAHQGRVHCADHLATWSGVSDPAAGTR